MNDAAMIAVFVVASLAIMDWRFERRTVRRSRIDTKLDALLKHTGAPFGPYEGLPATAIDALRRGRKIEAVLLYRKATGAGLKAAKDAIDEAVVRASSAV
jgi:hypothetical protein